MEKVITKIPLFLEASTRDELMMMCLKNNQINDKEFEYYQIYESNGSVIAWFRADLESYVPLRGESNAR